MDKTITLLFGLLALAAAGAAFVGGGACARQCMRQRAKVTYTAAAPASSQQAEKIAACIRCAVEHSLCPAL